MKSSKAYMEVSSFHEIKMSLSARSVGRVISIRETVKI